MPEAPVHKHGETLTAENKIGGSWQPLVSSPTFDSVGTEYRRQFQLRVLVALGPDCSHNLRAFLF
jgi:hypothetical protein